MTTADEIVDTPEADLLYWAWAVIANTGHNQGGWDQQDPEWLDAAKRWRDAFHAWIDENRQAP